jgi:hypothetical protein
MRRIEARLQPIPVEPRRLADYEGLAPIEQVERAARLAEPLTGARVLLVSAPPLEVDDISAALAPLLRGVGIDAERAILHGDRDFQLATAELADAIRGAEWAGDAGDWRSIREACEAAAVTADLRRHDAVLVQGVGAAALIEGRRSSSVAWVWRTGLDASAGNEHAWGLLQPLLAAYSGLCFALPAFVPPGVGGETLRVIPGAFDPLAPGQRELPIRELSRIARGLGLDLGRPLIAQLGALDRWADPLTTIDAWRAARDAVSGAQLAIAGRFDPGDPEAVSLLDEIRAFAGEFDDLHLLTDRHGVGDTELNALGRVARCTVHSTLGKHFDPAIAASLWRATPVIEPRADRIAELAAEPGRAVQLGLLGREQARARFLVTRFLGDGLELIDSLLGAMPEAPARAAPSEQAEAAA